MTVLLIKKHEKKIKNLNNLLSNFDFKTNVFSRTEGRGI